MSAWVNICTETYKEWPEYWGGHISGVNLHTLETLGWPHFRVWYLREWLKPFKDPDSREFTINLILGMEVNLLGNLAPLLALEIQLPFACIPTITTPR
jgi:hypothetical protein